MQLKELFDLPSFAGWVEIFVLAAMFYYVFRLFKGTRGAAILSGLIIVYAKLYEIGAGTSEIRRMLIGRELYRETT